MCFVIILNKVLCVKLCIVTTYVPKFRASCSTNSIESFDYWSYRDNCGRTRMWEVLWSIFEFELQKTTEDGGLTAHCAEGWYCILFCSVSVCLFVLFYAATFSPLKFWRPISHAHWYSYTIEVQFPVCLRPYISSTSTSSSRWYSEILSAQASIKFLFYALTWIITRPTTPIGCCV